MPVSAACSGCRLELLKMVLDPFSGSSTTLTVAKKLNREFFGFELSQEYAKLGTARIAAAQAGDRLEGAEEPKLSAPATQSAKARQLKKAKPEAKSQLKIKFVD